MRVFDELLAVAERLLGPNGCPWDLKQNFHSLQPYVLEEAHEVLEAVDSGDDKKIAEELGDLLYTIVFYATLAKKEKRFTMEEIVDGEREKLVRRHPHIFGEVKVATEEELVRNWENIKRTEKAHEERKSALDGIPNTLPLLPKAQKILKRIARSKSPVMSDKQNENAEQAIGEKFIELIRHAEEENVDVEGALRRTLSRYENAFREWERTHSV